MKAWRSIAQVVSAFVALVVALAIVPMRANAAPAAPFNVDQQAQVQALVRQYLLTHPEIVEQAMQTLEQRRTTARFQKIVSDPRHFSIGAKTAKVTIVEFFDYRCPHCKDALAWTMDKVRNRRDVRVVFVEFPILSPQSLEAAQAAVASIKQGRYLAFHQALMSSHSTLEAKDIDDLAKRSGIDVARMRRDMKDPAIMALLQDNQEVAEAAKINGTPAYFINGKFFSGYQPDGLDQSLRQATQEANAHGKAGG